IAPEGAEDLAHEVLPSVRLLLGSDISGALVFVGRHWNAQDGPAFGTAAAPAGESVLQPESRLARSTCERNSHRGGSLLLASRGTTFGAMPATRRCSRCQGNWHLRSS